MPRKPRFVRRLPVESSTVRQVAYDPASQVLEVEFHKTGKYHYFHVLPEMFCAFLSAESLGRWINQHKPFLPYKKVAEKLPRPSKRAKT